MEIEDDKDLTFIPEGDSVRARAGSVDILFPHCTRDALVQAYNEWRPRVQAHFEPRWRDHSGAKIPEADLRSIVREITLIWMAFCVKNRMPIRMGATEWDHPTTRRIIQAAVEQPKGSRRGLGLPGTALLKKAGPISPKAALCAQSMGISPAEYRNWVEGEEWLQEIM